MIKEMFKEVPIMSSIMAFVILAVAFIIIDSAASKPEAFYGNIVDKHYEAKSHRTGTGVGVTSSGNSAVVVTSETEPEKYLLKVRTSSGNIVTVKCSPELYYQKEVGQSIDCIAYIGFFTGNTWSLHGVR
tara:strand:- start:1389 stop:1778 length:390 start_codon:yes stop_codon:yes gene_type:complete